MIKIRIHIADKFLCYRSSLYEEVHSRRQARPDDFMKIQCISLSAFFFAKQYKAKCELGGNYKKGKIRHYYNIIKEEHAWSIPRNHTVRTTFSIQNLAHKQTESYFEVAIINLGQSYLVFALFPCSQSVVHSINFQHFVWYARMLAYLEGDLGRLSSRKDIPGPLHAETGLFLSICTHPYTYMF